ncbi:MAG: glutamate racemase [Spirochaetia bacterium]|nr:glutamate racemase [Spirochaetia bacterium]
MSKVVGFYDSGIGGLPYLEWLKKHTTGCSFRYLAESAHFPFGTKTEPEIKSIVAESIGRFIESEHPDLIVIACNTASVTALELLRQKYSIPFVGVVPAIKPAAAISRKKSIGLFATNKTVSQLYTKNLIDSFASGCTVSKFAMPEIVAFVEKNIFTAAEDEITRIITPAADFFKKQGVDTVILGCTHFVYLEDTFKKVLGSTISVIDSREGVGNRAISLLEKIKSHADDGKGDMFFVTSIEKMPGNYKSISSRYGLSFGGEI